MLYDQFGFRVRRLAGFAAGYARERFTTQDAPLADCIGFHCSYTEPDVEHLSPPPETKVTAARHSNLHGY